MSLKRIRTSVLEIAYEESGPADGDPVLLMHGWPYDARDYDRVVPLLTAAGCRTIVPYLRGFGPTQFLSADTPRSGQQAALGHDLKELMDALGIARAGVAGYDWGGRAACIVAALWPERARFLVTGNGYNIQDIAGSATPASPEQELRYWYQYYFHTERGRAGLAQNRRAFIRLLWRLWSPNWAFDDARFERSPRPGTIPTSSTSRSSPTGTATATRRAIRPMRRSSRSLRRSRSSPCPQSRCRAKPTACSRRPPSPRRTANSPAASSAACCRGVGHNPPQEAPEVFARAILELMAAAR